MNFEPFYAEPVRSMEPVEIRKVVDMIDGADVISLGAGWPNAETFPLEAIADVTATTLANRGKQALQYDTTAGYDRLRHQIAARMREESGTDVSAKNVLITSGAQQALYLVARAFLDDSDGVIVGGPTYAAAKTVFDRVGAPEYLSIPLDEEGMNVDALAEQLASTDAKLAYVIPSFQNPAGVTMSDRRRKRLLNLAREHDLLLIEDQPYRDLRYEGTAHSPLVSSNDDRVVYLGSFSKILAPGFRLGWIAADEQLIRTLEVLKQPVDLQTNVFVQHVTSEYIALGVLDEQIDATVATYARKRDVMLDALDQEMPAGVDWTIPEGGMFIWLTLPESVDAKELLPDAIDAGVAYIPGFAFYADDPKHNTMRLNFTSVSDRDIRTGIERLALTLQRRL